MQRKLRILFFTACATIVSVGIWIVALLFNLLNWALQPAGLSRPVSWSILVASGAGFWLLFYRHFSRVEPRE